MRDLNNEHADSDTRLYAYDFDYRMHAYMLDVFVPHMPKGRVLELGCYHGLFTQKLNDIYEDVTVVEGSSDLIQIAKDRVKERTKFIHSTFEDFNPDDKFDAIYLIHTLEHLDDAVATISKIKTWLSKHGCLFIAVPNAYAASRQIAVNMGLITEPTAVTEAEFKHGHRKTYDLNMLKNDILTSNLNIIDSGGILFKPLANYQLDKCLNLGIIDDKFLNGCYILGKKYPELCSSIYAVCKSNS